MTPRGLGDAIRAALREAADPTRARGQQAYMKSTMPFLGVRVPQVRRLVREHTRAVDDREVLLTAARVLWDEAALREERYAAAAITRLSRFRGDPALVPFYEHMVRTGAWWDHVDELARPMAALHDAHPAGTAELVRQWSRDESPWMRRLAIVSQLGRGQHTDLELLDEVITPSLGDREFFVRKAIGWALREAAKTHPQWVRSYVDTRSLSPLSRREAMRHLREG